MPYLFPLHHPLPDDTLTTVPPPLQTALEPCSSPNLLQPQTAPHQAIPTRWSSRLCKPPIYLQEYHCNLATTSSDQHESSSMVVPHSIAHPLSSVISYSNLSPKHLAFNLDVSYFTEPKTYSQAIKHNCW